MYRYVDIIVTYNRLNLLRENIEALRAQSFYEHDIFIIDNASSDGTQQMVCDIEDERIKYFNTQKNLGGAGGFAYGIRKAIEMGYDFAWIMDDDSIPEKDALISLVGKSKEIDEKFSFFASLVYWTDGNLCRMNVPSCQHKNKMDYNLDLISKHKLFPINACSFVGCFINLKHAEVVGLPIAEFFIYGDDVEYTTRLRNSEKAYLDLDSIIIHKAPLNFGADIATANKERIGRFFFQARNGIYIAKKSHTICRRCITVLGEIRKIAKKSPDKKLKRIWMLIKGTFAGFYFNPPIQYAKRKEINREYEE